MYKTNVEKNGDDETQPLVWLRLVICSKSRLRSRDLGADGTTEVRQTAGEFGRSGIRAGPRDELGRILYIGDGAHTWLVTSTIIDETVNRRTYHPIEGLGLDWLTDERAYTC